MILLPRKVLVLGATAPEYQSHTNQTQTSNTTGARTWSHTTVAGTKCLVVAYGFRTGTSLGSQSCTYNGVSMTQNSGAYISISASPSGASGIFYLLDPPIGTYTVSLTTASNQRVGASAINTTATSAGPVNEISGTASSRTIAVTTDAAAVVIATSCSHQGSYPATSMTGETILAYGDGATGYGISYTEPATAGSQSFTHTHSTSGRMTMVMQAFY
jgi:hypothetical protein